MKIINLSIHDNFMGYICDTFTMYTEFAIAIKINYVLGREIEES